MPANHPLSMAAVLLGLLWLPLAGVAEVPVASSQNPLWLVEQPYASNPLLTARLAGSAQVAAFRSNATLMLSCHPNYPGISLGLQISAEQLGFAVAPFEGPDATANGPLRLSSGSRPSQPYLVSGAYRDAGSFQVGTIFEFLLTPEPQEMAYWASDAGRGQLIKLRLETPQVGLPGLSAEFQLPQDTAGIRHVLGPCLNPKQP